MKRILSRLVALSAVVVGAVACASVPPPDDRVSAARDVIAVAEGVGAYEHAPFELHMAREHLDQAQQALAEEEFVEARRLAELATAHAELARRKAEAVENERAAEELRTEIEVLERDLETRLRP